MGIVVRNLQKKIKVDVPFLKRVGEGMLQDLGFGSAECGLLFVGDARIARLNHAYLGGEGPTDVLSFPLAEVRGQRSGVRGQKGTGKNQPVLDFSPQPPAPHLPLLGDVVISVETAKRQAERKRRPLQEEMAHLLVHGILHLLGYDHATPHERRRMRRLERRFLAPFFPREQREA